jgi:hypothetical protein
MINGLLQAFIDGFKEPFRVMRMIKVKEFVPRFGLGVSLHSDSEERNSNLLHIHLIWGSLWIEIPRIIKAKVERIKADSWRPETIARMGRNWYEKKTEKKFGFSFSDSHLHLYYGIQPGCWSRNDPENSDHTKLFALPWNDWDHIRHEVMLNDGTWVPAPEWRGAEKELDPANLYREQFSYRYKDRHVDQTATATITVERREWRLKLLRWTQLFAKNRQSINVAFSEEMGSERGSWKGGVMGCSYTMKSGETPEQTLRRMEVERKFR